MWEAPYCDWSSAGRGVDLVHDGLGGAFTREAVACLGQHGTHVVYGFAAEPRAEVSLYDLVVRCGRLVGFGPLNVAYPPDVIEQAYQVVGERLGRGLVCPPLARVFPLAEAASAQRHLIEERPFGKVVLAI